MLFVFVFVLIVFSLFRERWESKGKLAEHLLWTNSLNLRAFPEAENQSYHFLEFQ